MDFLFIFVLVNQKERDSEQSDPGKNDSKNWSSEDDNGHCSLYIYAGKMANKEFFVYYHHLKSFT